MQQNGGMFQYNFRSYYNEKLIESLLRKRYFDPNQVNDNNETPLHYGLKEGSISYQRCVIYIL